MVDSCDAKPETGTVDPSAAKAEAEATAAAADASAAKPAGKETGLGNARPRNFMPVIKSNKPDDKRGSTQ